MIVNRASSLEQYHSSVDDESKKYLTVNTHKGLFTFNRLPFGVASAPAIFQRTMEGLLQGIANVAVYLDDIIMTGKTKAEHLATLDEVLTRLEEARLRLKKDKYEFLQDAVEYLGHRVDAQGLRPVEKTVIAIVDTTAPTSVNQLQSYLGSLNYYHRFLPNLSTLLAPLHALLGQGAKWTWKNPQEEVFRKSKELLQSAKVLVHYDADKELVLSCDASLYGVGAVLSHRMEDGSEKPVSYMSRTLTKAEKNYSQLDKEGLAIMFGIKKFHRYLYGRASTICTDHKPLISLFSEKKAIHQMGSPRVQRWAVTQGAYEYSIVYKPGRLHANANLLSRVPMPGNSDQEVNEQVLMLDMLYEAPVDTTQIRQWTARDSTLSQVHNFVLNGWPLIVDPLL